MTPDEIQALIPYLIMPSQPDRDGRIWSYCPAHPDGQRSGRRPAAGSNLYGRSLSLHPQYGLTCFSGCAFREIMEAFGRLGYQRPGNGGRRGQREPVRIYRYCDERGNLIAEKGRFEPGPNGRSKTFLWRAAGEERWAGIRSITARIPLYATERIARLDPDTPVYVVEGEKAAEACWEQGLAAVSPPNGANGAFSLGPALEILRDRNVYLWPDNDDVGRKFMLQLAGVLRPIARSVGIINVPVPPHGDAYDYFAAGFTKDDVHRSALSDTPYAIVSAPGEYTCRYSRTPDGIPVTFTATNLQFSRDSIEAVIRIDTGAPPPYRQRINMLSLSSRQALARELKDIYGDRNWPRALAEAFSAIAEVARQTTAAIDVAVIDHSAAQKADIIPGILMDGEASIIYGHGSSGKTYVSLYLFLMRAIGGMVGQHHITQAPVLWLDYETRQDGSVVARRINRLLAGVGLAELPQDTFLYLPGRGLPIWELYDTLDTIITREGVSLIGVDSALKAVGGDVRSELSVGQYFACIQRLGIASLTLAHVSKGEHTDTPFGSVFWINEPHGYVWHASKDDAASTPSCHAMSLIIAKSNEGSSISSHAVTIDFEDPAGPVTVTIRSAADDGDVVGRISSAIEAAGGTIAIAELSKLTRLPNRTIMSIARGNSSTFKLRMDRSSGSLVISFAD